MEKSRDAFRTISEVAEWLDVPTHVLRFWESRFSQIKPVKRAGGRRYYRPSDMRVIGGVKALLHDQGMTIRGVQKLFREKGIKHISSHAPELYGDDIPQKSDPAIIEHKSDDTEPTQPAPVARFTRSAAPDPIVDERDPIGEHDVAVEMKEPTVEFAHDKASISEPEAAPSQTPQGAAQTDPTDDDEAHAKGASIAARLRAIPHERLLGHRDLLANAALKLKAIHERAN